MLLYIITFIILLIPVIRFDLMRLEGNRQMWLAAEYIILILICGLRYRVGGDTLFYMDFFEGYPTISELSTFDYESAPYNPMWYYYNSIFKTFGDSFLFFQIVHSILVNTAFFRFFRKTTPYYFSAILIYFLGYYFYFNMEILREVLCIALLLEAYPYLLKKKWIAYYLFCLLAISIHMSAILMFFLPLVSLVKKDYFGLTIIIVAGVVILLKVVNVIDILLSLAFEGHTAAVIRGYLDKQTPNAIGATITFLIAIPFMLIMFVRNRHNYTNDELMGKFLYVLILIQTMGMFIPVIPRFSNYILPFGIIYMINTLYEHYWDIRLHLFSEILVAIAFFIYSFNLSYFYLKNKNEDLRGAHVYNRYLPYYSALNPQVDKTREMLLMNERTEIGILGER